MSQLIILGNGFDLQCDLESSYKDFFRCSILDTYSEQCGFPKMQQDCEGFWETLLFMYYKEYGSVDYKWCDIEEIIRLTLLDINIAELECKVEGRYENLHINICSNKYPSNYALPDKIIQEQNITTFIERSFDKYIQENCNQDYYDDLYPKLFLITSTQKFYHFLLQELKKFEKRFCKYIKDKIANPKNENELNDKYIVNAANLIAKLTGFSSSSFESIEDIIDQKEIEEWVQVTRNMSSSSWEKINVLSDEFAKLKGVHILSFNYTALFDILAVESPCLYSNVHGKLCYKKCNESCTASSVIFGIDDTVIQSQKTNDELRLFSKTYRKIFDTNAPTSILPSNDGKPLTIKFYGHSLSEADYSYFQSIFDYYNLYENSKVDLIFYYSKGYEQTDAIYRLINSYGKTLLNQEQGKNLMHKLLLENRVKIIEISLNK